MKIQPFPPDCLNGLLPGHKENDSVAPKRIIAEIKKGVKAQRIESPVLVVWLNVMSNLLFSNLGLRGFLLIYAHMFYSYIRQNNKALEDRNDSECQPNTNFTCTPNPHLRS